LTMKTSLNIKTYDNNVVDLSFLYNFSIWEALFGYRKLEILALKYRLLRKP
jgi:hypothetical protein